MLLSIFISHSAAIGECLFENGINDKLLGNRVPGELPGKLVLPLDLLLVGSRGEDLVVVVLDLAVVFLDGVDDAGRHGDG
jgi:hypothetical protein